MTKSKKSKDWYQLKDESCLLKLNIRTKKQVNLLFYAALKDNKITLHELEYQAKGLKTNEYKTLVVAAFIQRACSDFVKNHKKVTK